MTKTAFLCSGQGAQQVGMGVDFAETYPTCAALFDQVDTASGLEIRKLCEQGPLEELGQTQNTQPALVATSLAIAIALIEHGVEPDCVAGFSLGEYAAHALAKTIDSKTAFELVSRRGAAMAHAAHSNPGGMAALLRCSAEQAEALCADHAAKYGQVLVAANLNCPGQVVISGQTEALESACAAWKEAGGRFVPVKTSGAFHSPLMEPAARQMRPALDATQFSAPAIDLYCNCTARPLVPGTEAEMLYEQIVSPVRWQETIEHMVSDGVERFVECGPGKVLTGLVKRTARAIGAKVELVSIGSVEDLEAYCG
ncbi:MAG: ACP S-malonyltransferase [Coriobacteriales bacterium]|jgi:[acyl-carrier-protein] S-malonyltransferase